jgi:hypothetical protein
MQRLLLNGFLCAIIFSSIKTQAQGCPNAIFEPVRSFWAQASPSSVTAGDFNNDIITVNSSFATYSVALGNGTGNFNAVTVTPLNQQANYVTSADLNRDGNLDLITSHFSINNLQVSLGNGNGTFSGPLAYGTASLSTHLAVSDLNNDGHLDVVTANPSDGNISVRLGSGSGRLFFAGNFPVSGAPVSVSTGDFNNDGKLDIVTANEGFGTPNQNTTSLLLGNGLGGFSSPLIFPLGGISPQQIAVADFNRDNNLDLVTVNSTSDNISVLLGNGNGNFSSPQIFSLRTAQTFNLQATSLAVGDVNSDGKLDVVVSAFNSVNAIVLLGSGTGSFGTPSYYFIQERIADNPIETVLKDVNNDGKLDVITAHGRYNVSVLLNNCNASNPGYTTNGSARATDPTCYELTPAIIYNAGSIWNNTIINLNQNFDIQARLYFGATDNGADGLAFVLQSNGLTAIGEHGGGIGYSKMPGASFAIEFDTYQNTEAWFNTGDPAADHIGFMKNGNAYHTSANGPVLAAPVVLPANIENNQWHNARFVWNAATKTMTVHFLNNTYTYTGYIVNTIFGGNPLVYWGFTASTGSPFPTVVPNQQQVCITSVNINASGRTAIDNSLTVQPNPSNGNVEVILSEPLQGSANLQVLNSSGNVVYKRTVVLNGSYQVISMDLTFLSNGIYFIQMQTGNGLKMQKIVVQK